MTEHKETKVNWIDCVFVLMYTRNIQTHECVFANCIKCVNCIDSDFDLADLTRKVRVCVLVGVWVCGPPFIIHVLSRLEKLYVSKLPTRTEF